MRRAKASITLLDTQAPALSAVISGPTGVPSGDSGTWFASVGAQGTAPYTYSWSGLFSGTASSVSGSPMASGYLYLQINDSAGHSANASWYVTVCDPSQLTCANP